MRNSVNVGLGAGGAMVETMGNMDSRPSSTDSCKSNSNVSDPNNAMSFKDVLVQFAKLSQQQGELTVKKCAFSNIYILNVTAYLVFCRRANKNTSKLSRRNAAPGRSDAHDAELRAAADGLRLASPRYPHQVSVTEAHHFLADAGQAPHGAREGKKRAHDHARTSPEHAAPLAGLSRRQSCLDQ